MPFYFGNLLTTNSTMAYEYLQATVIAPAHSPQKHYEYYNHYYRTNYTQA
jgi:hypothetical protein